MASKVAEAGEHLKKAEKYLKTSFMKWSPDFDSAGDEYSRAATCFKVARKHEATLDALEKACECYKQIKSLYQAAKMLEQAVLICRDCDRLPNIVEYAERGGLLYRQHGSPEAAAQLLQKAAKILEPKHPEKALTLYVKASETIATEDRPKEASDYLTKVARLQVKAKMWEEAATTLRQTINLQSECGKTMVTGRLAGSLVLVHLAREDIVAANKAYSEFSDWCDSDLKTSLKKTLQGYEDNEPGEVRLGLDSPGIRSLDIEFARMAAKDIPLPDDGGGLEAAASAYGAERAAALSSVETRNPKELNPEGASELPVDKKEDNGGEDDDGLC